MDDKTLIAELGGAARVAELLGLDKKRGGTQRVHNWLSRGIPARVKLERPDLFQVNRPPNGVLDGGSPNEPATTGAH